MKGKIQNLIDSGSISLLEDSGKALLNQVSITEDASKISEPQEPDEHKS